MNRRFSWALVAAPVLAVSGISVVAAAPATAHVAASRPQVTKPAKASQRDCNGWSLKYASLVPMHRMDCVDPHGPLQTRKGYQGATPQRSGKNARWSRFLDNGHYVGHDEPSVKFESSAPGSGNTMTYFVQLPKDPAKRPTNNGSVIDYAELSIAPWFGLPMCDPNSYPENPCTPDSDTNSGGINDPNAAGSAFMELQLYPPGFPPFADSESCNSTQWCSALTIDSFESKFNFVDENQNCAEPQNFAFLSRTGKPTGPAGPADANARTFVPNKHTLLMNPGDILKVAITDPGKGFTTTITDLTTHHKGWMTASGANGFQTTNPSTCAGTKFTFHAEYSTAKAANQVPWAALQGGVLMQQEIGHSEICDSLTSHDPVREGGLITDSKVFDTCVGSDEGGKKDPGEGPCKGVVCKHAMTEGTSGPIACPSNNILSGQLCEFADGFCLPQGTRTVRLLGHVAKETSPVNWCADNRFQNGDLDFDGVSYSKTAWPDGSRNVPTSFRYAGPFDKNGNAYPQIQFETDIPGSEFLCNTFTGNLCTTPPLSANFYPFWTLTNKKGQNVGHGMFPKGACIWNFGNTIPGVTTRNFGKDRQYGVSAVKVYGGTDISKVMSNPEINTHQGCTALHLPS